MLLNHLWLALVVASKQESSLDAMISQPNFGEAPAPEFRNESLPEHKETQSEFSDDFKGIFQTIWRRRIAFLCGFIPVLLAAATYLYTATPQFTASAILVLDPRKQVVTTSPEVLPDADPNSSMVDTQVELIQSRAVLSRAIDKLDAQEQQPANSTSRLLKQALYDVFGWPALVPVQEKTREHLIDQLGSGLDVSRVGLTFAIRISYESADPSYSAKAANSIGAAYREYQVELKQQATKDANLWLAEQVNELRSRVEAAESAVDQYRSRSGLLMARGSTSTENQLTSLDLGFNEAQQRFTEARAKLDSYRNALSTAGAAEAAKIVATPLMQSLRNQYMALANQRAQFSPTLGPSHPQMLELNRQFAGVQAEMNAEANRTISELESDTAVAERKVAGLLAIRDGSRTKLAQDNAANVELSQLQANAQSVRKLYEDMLTRLQQTSAQESRNQVSATIVSEALTPSEPSSPKFNVVIPSALVIGLALGAFATMLAQLLDRKITNPRELERKTGVPVLALAPSLRNRDLKMGGRRIPIAEFIQAKPLSLYAEAFRSLRVAVQQSSGRTSPLIIQITSGTFSEGKTVSSISFAQAAAMDGRRVLLIDADVRTRSLTKNLGITREVGLMELLRGKASLEAVLIAGGEQGRAHVLPLSMNDAGPHDRFSGQMFASLLQRLRKGFDLIVIDSAPVLVVAESLVLASRVDAVVVVARWASTPVETTVKALEAINRAGGRVAGTLLTQVDIKKVFNQTYGKGHYPALIKYYQQ